MNSSLRLPGILKSSIPLFAILVFFIPLIISIPALILDILIALNLIFALLILLIASHTKKVLDFSLCPSALLVSTLFGLVINISAARLILSQGTLLGSRFIRLFSDFIASSGTSIQSGVNFIIYFIILGAIVFVFLRGWDQMTESANRHFLDAYPGKVKAIDAEYCSGTITQDEAASGKDALEKESEFYTAMDGVNKFISGYGKFMFFIFVFILIGGTFIDTQLRGESFGMAVRINMNLGIGSGYIFIIHLLLLSMTVGISVTRIANKDSSYGTDSQEMLFLKLIKNIWKSWSISQKVICFCIMIAIITGILAIILPLSPNENIIPAEKLIQTISEENPHQWEEMKDEMQNFFYNNKIILCGIIIIIGFYMIIYSSCSIVFGKKYGSLLFSLALFISGIIFLLL